MLAMLSSTFLAVSLLSGFSPVLASTDNLWENDNYVGQNLRPQNISGLYSWLYGWTGSYYNGTVSIQMDVVDWTGGDDSEDKPCSSLLNTSIDLSYDGVLGITKTLLEDENPLMFILTAWEDGTNLTTGRQQDDYKYSDLPLRIASLSEPPKLGFTLDPTRAWNVTTKHLTSSALSSSSFSYALSAAYDFDPDSPYTTTPIPLNFNHSTCNSALPSLYAGSLLLPSNTSRFAPLHPDTPRLMGQFDNTTASISIEGFYSANAYVGDVDDGEWEEPTIAGPIRISFLGKVDEARSDEFVVTGNSTPTWESTLGFEKTLDGEGTGGGARVGVVMEYGYWVVLFWVALGVL
ncbi:hypothetical protein FQN54_008458 [Arachnomyces sp. PD_36]|nr:hypothetical protein FQN54_008458 [Arachnomyces sp. PD_36]